MIKSHEIVVRDLSCQQKQKSARKIQTHVFSVMPPPTPLAPGKSPSLGKLLDVPKGHGEPHIQVTATLNTGVGRGN